MRYIFIVCFSFCIQAKGQVINATLQAAGLTCAMCSNAIYQSLIDLPSIDQVNPDVEHSSFYIRFKSGMKIDPDEIRSAVEAAGFSIGEFFLTVRINASQVTENKIIQLEEIKLKLLNESFSDFNQEIKLLIYEKDFLTDKKIKDYEKKIGKKLNKKREEDFYHVWRL
jgi:copper chaperone CopZ